MPGPRAREPELPATSASWLSPGTLKPTHRGIEAPRTETQDFSASLCVVIIKRTSSFHAGELKNGLRHHRVVLFAVAPGHRGVKQLLDDRGDRGRDVVLRQGGDDVAHVLGVEVGLESRCERALQGAVSVDFE